MRPSIWLALGLTFVAPVYAQAPQLALKIVPTSVRDAGAQIELRSPTQHFWVVLTNTGSTPVRVWREWCSWGYAALSFEVEHPPGRRNAVSKREREWDKNFPDWTQLGPGEQLVFEVSFDPAVWSSPPLPTVGAQHTVSLRAIFQIKDSPEAKRHSVWVGRIESAQSRYTIFR